MVKTTGRILQAIANTTVTDTTKNTTGTNTTNTTGTDTTKTTTPTTPVEDSSYLWLAENRYSYE